MTAKRVRRVKADTDRVLKCISELGRFLGISSPAFHQFYKK